MMINNRVMKNVVCGLITIFILCSARSVVSGADLPGAYQKEQTYAQTVGQTAGWREIGGRRYYVSAETGAVLTGWQEIDGKSYYFEPETGEMRTGRQELEDGIYYFSPQTGEMLTGWQQIGEEKRYFSPSSGRMTAGWQEMEDQTYYISKQSGETLTGLQKIDGNRYYFDRDGVLLTEQWINQGSKRYYSDSEGVLLSDWQEIDGATYYFLPENNRMAAGSQEIDGEYYIFHRNGRLARSKRTGIVTVGNKNYCADRQGKAAEGWQIIGKKLYYATHTGKVKSSTTWQGITFRANGAAKDNEQSRLKIKVMQTVASVTNDRMTKSQKLNACWSYVSGGSFRYAVKYPNLNASGWQRQTAYDMLSSKSGNCYGFACAFAALAEEIGYQPYIICGRVRGSRDRAADGYTRHAWVRINGRNYDPEAQYAGWRRGIYGNTNYPVSHAVQKIVAY